MNDVFVIDPITRQVNVPGSSLVFGVEADAGSERKYFQCVRYVGDNIDLAACFIRVNYRNANGDTDFYLVEDVLVDGENIVFSWKIGPLAVKYKGQTKFVICAIGPDLKLKWHTTQATGVVLAGLEPDNSHVESETSDAVAQLVAMVESQTGIVKTTGAEQVTAVKAAAKAAETAAVAEVDAKGRNTLASIPADYTALGAAVDGLARATAPGIVCDAAGAVISVSDASDQSIRGLRIFGRSTQDGTPTPDAPVEIKSVERPVVTASGKNLFPNHVKDYANADGTTVKVNTDGSITVHKVAGAGLSFRATVYFPAGTYTLSNGLSEGHVVYLQAFELSTNGAPSRTIDWGGGETGVYLFSRDVAVGDVTLFPQIEVGSEATAYEPYKAAQTVETTHTIRGIPVASGGNYTDENGQQWICDEVDFERGVFVQRTKIATLTDARGVGKSLPNDATSWMYYYVTPNKEMNDAAPVLCDSLLHNASLSPYSSVGFRNSNDGNSVIYFNVSTYMTENSIAAVGAALGEHPITFVYSLVNSIEIPLSENEIAAYRALHTNKPNTTIVNDAGAHMAVAYTADTKLYIDNLIKNL